MTRKKRQPVVCGTRSGYDKHYRKKEMPCDECHKALLDEWVERRKTKPEINIKRKAWRDDPENKYKYQSRRTKARELGIEYDYHADQDVIDKYGTKCHICNEEIDFTAPRKVGIIGWQRSFHVDHVVPTSKNGSNTIDNVRPSHAECNIRKNATLMEDLWWKK